MHLNKLGFMSGFTEIEAESKRNLLTIDSFKDRCMFVFNAVRGISYSPQTCDMIDEMIDEFLCSVE